MIRVMGTNGGIMSGRMIEIKVLRLFEAMTRKKRSESRVLRLCLRDSREGGIQDFEVA